MVSRRELVSRVQSSLVRMQAPRFQMAIIVSLTGGAGFLLAFLMLSAGLRSMSLRYPLAVLGAYVVFLALLRVWLAYQARKLRNGGDWLDLADFLDLVPLRWGRWSRTIGEGGRFGGAGASLELDGATAALLSTEGAPSPPGSLSIAEARDVLDLDFDEGCLPLLVGCVLLLLVGGILGWALWIAPVLLAEVLVDGLLTVGLYRRLHGVRGRHWLSAVVRRTWLPVLGFAALLAVAGWAMQAWMPAVDSIGDLLQLRRTPAAD